MTNIYQAQPNELIEQVAEKMKTIPEIKAPEWASYAKTGMHRERPPLRRDWWQVRAASVLRWVQIRGPVGVSKLRTKYGGRKNRGVRPDLFFKASGNVLRTILQQLESADLVKKKDEGVHKGRVITPKGMSLLSGKAK
jgi:small subunit ribosomal protein S19e